MAESKIQVELLEQLDLVAVVLAENTILLPLRPALLEQVAEVVEVEQMVAIVLVVLVVLVS